MKFSVEKQAIGAVSLCLVEGCTIGGKNCVCIPLDLPMSD